MQEINKNLIILFVCLLFIFLLFEFFFRLFFPQPVFEYTIIEAAGKFYNESTYIPWQVKPSIEIQYFNEFNEFNVSVKHNSLGYRDNEFNITKSPDTTRILFIGDSFTHGFGVELNETYHQIFERKLNKGDKKYEIINAGYKGGESPDTEYLYLKKEGLSLNPDIVAIGFFMGNDFENPLDSIYYFDENGELEKIVSENFYIDEQHRLRKKKQVKRGFLRDNLYKLNVFLSFHSHFYVFFKNSFRNTLSNFYGGKPLPGIYADEYDAQTQKEVDIVLNFILKMKEITEENNSNLVLVLIPRREEVYESEIIDNKDNLFNWSRPYNILTDFAEENNITIINLLPHFREYISNNNTPIYFFIDPHWNKNGHYIASEYMYEEFQEKVFSKDL